MQTAEQERERDAWKTLNWNPNGNEIKIASIWIQSHFHKYASIKWKPTDSLVMQANTNISLHIYKEQKKKKTVLHGESHLWDNFFFTRKEEREKRKTIERIVCTKRPKTSEEIKRAAKRQKKTYARTMNAEKSRTTHNIFGEYSAFGCNTIYTIHKHWRPVSAHRYYI